MGDIVSFMVVTLGTALIFFIMFCVLSFLIWGAIKLIKGVKH